MNDFERQLRRAEFRALPPEWREEILGRVSEPAAVVEDWTWRDWLWPSPVAWGALAAVWLVFFSLGALDSASSPPSRTRLQTVSPERLSSVPLLAQRSSSDLELLFSDHR